MVIFQEFKDKKKVGMYLVKLEIFLESFVNKKVGMYLVKLGLDQMEQELVLLVKAKTLKRKN